MQEALSGVRTLRALGLEASAARPSFGELAEQAAEASLARAAMGSRLRAGGGPDPGRGGDSLTLALGGYLVWHNQLTIGALTSFTMYLGQLIWPMFAAGWVLSLIERGTRRMGALAAAAGQRRCRVDDHGSVQTFSPGRAGIEPSAATRYAGQSVQRPALDDISLQA